jgi:hypothetical protein
MSASDELKRLYDEMIASYEGGLSNTSTAKFDDMRDFFAALFGLGRSDVYAVGAGTRTTNLPIRFSQGRQATQETALGVGFVVNVEGRTVEATTKSATTTLCNYAERGRGHYKSMILVVVDHGQPLVTRMIKYQNSGHDSVFSENFPDADIIDATAGSLTTGTTTDDLLGIISGNDDVGDGIPDGYISRSLLSKPFLILTGPSGTGKTRGAIQFAESLCEPDCMAVVAVGADWTDNRHVVGFLNPLQSQDDVPVYEATEILNLLLHANGHPDLPHVLILDEMNLSHVERYFADFLSAMELKNKKGALKLHSAALAKTREDADVEGRIDFPENLFVIGTVNIDETTYMFSPKVLDRANVIEIHADPTEFDHFLKGTNGGSEPEVRDHGVLFLEAARVIQREAVHAAVPGLPGDTRGLVADRLLELFRIMKRGRGEFGFRTGREVLAYLRTAYFLTPANEQDAWASEGGDWQKALDQQILQKILPKLHGSRTRLSPLLGALATYCGSGNEAQAMEHFPEGASAPKRGLNDARGIATPKFEKSYKKLERMIEVLVEEGSVNLRL